MWYVLHLVGEINVDTKYRGKSMWAGPTLKKILHLVPKLSTGTKIN